MKSPVGKSDKPSTHVVPISKSDQPSTHVEVAAEVCLHACVFCLLSLLYVRAAILCMSTVYALYPLIVAIVCSYLHSPDRIPVSARRILCRHLTDRTTLSQTWVQDHVYLETCVMHVCSLEDLNEHKT